MRKALVSLIAAGTAAISIPALAQETTAPAPGAAAPVPAAEPAAPPAPPPLPAAVDPAVRSLTQTYITPEAAPGAVPAAEPEPVAPPAPPPPAPPPTDPVTIAVLNAIETVCKPLVHGGDLKALATPLGYKAKKDVYTYVVAKPYQVSILPQGSNKNVCMLEVDYALDQVEPIVVGVHNWAMARGWTLYRNDVYTTDFKRHTRSWEHGGETENEALVLVALKKADGTPINRTGDHATVLYSVTPAAPAQ